MDLISYPISLYNEEIGWCECCNVSPRSLVNTEGPSSSSFREQCSQNPQFFKKGYLVQIEDPLPESACIQCLIDVDTMPGPSPQLCTAFQVISDSELPNGSTDALSELPSSPVSPSAQSCFWILFFHRCHAQEQSGMDILHSTLCLTSASWELSPWRLGPRVVWEAKSKVWFWIWVTFHSIDNGDLPWPPDSVWHKTSVPLWIFRPEVNWKVFLWERIFSQVPYVEIWEIFVTLKIAKLGSSLWAPCSLNVHWSLSSSLWRITGEDIFGNRLTLLDIGSWPLVMGKSGWKEASEMSPCSPQFS